MTTEKGQLSIKRESDRRSVPEKRQASVKGIQRVEMIPEKRHASVKRESGCFPKRTNLEIVAILLMKESLLFKKKGLYR